MASSYSARHGGQAAKGRAGGFRMSKILVIGAGGVGSVAVHKMAQNADIFPDITLASRRRFKCDAIAESVKARTGVTIRTAEVDADHIAATAALIREVGATHEIGRRHVWNHGT